MVEKSSKTIVINYAFIFALMGKLFFIVLICFFSKEALGQNPVQEDILFKDTAYNIAFDSLKHNFGKINPETQSRYLIKHFKYLGTEPLSIKKAWTNDPYYICDYPKEELIPNKIYAFTICFSHKGRVGIMNKQMGFDLSDGNRVFMRFTGEYVKQ
jgi:hypothetical protein